MHSFFQREEDRGAGHVAVAAQDFAGFGELKGWQRGFDCFDHIAATGVGDDLVGPFFKSCVKRGDRFGGEFGHAAVKLVFEFAGGVYEADFFAFDWDMMGIESMETTAIIVVGISGEDRGCGAIAEEAERNEHAGFVVDVKSGGGDFHCDDCDGV